MSKQTILTFTIICLLQTVFAQGEKYFTRNAAVTFTSVAPVEKIISSNKVANCILNTQTGDLALKVVVKSFEFDKQAMADHFNNDYLNSDKFPNATFDGKITTPVNYTKNGKYEVVVEGKLTIHGITKPVKQSGTIEVNASKITAKSKFTIKLSDYGIIVPNDYLKKISNTVDIEVNASMTPYVR